ncbi:MAG TPA: DcrB-related protein [Candidatus Deferrimicrobium sp.]|nr:DcrB-related protein [Candidatus Deferrimicrobium sp.]
MASLKSNERFHIELPDGWEDRTVHYFLGPDDSGVQRGLTLTIDRHAHTSDLIGYARERIDHVLNTLPAAEILKEEQKTLPTGVPIYEAVCKWIPPSGEVSFQKLVYMIHDGVAYSFSANFSKKTLKTIALEVDRIIGSFRPGDSAPNAE